MNDSDGRPGSGDGPIRVLFVVSQLGLGGTEKNLAELVLAMDRSRFTPEVLVFESGGEHESVLRAANVPIHAVTPRLGRYLDRTAALRERCRAFRPHVLQGFGIFVGPYVGVAGRLTGVPMVATTLFASGMPPAARRFYGVGWRLFDHFVCNNTVARAFLSERCAVPLSRIALVPNGLDFARMEEGAAHAPQLRGQLGLDPDTLLVGAVGKLNHEKDPMTFARAAKRIAGQRPGVSFCYVGSGPDRPTLEAYVAEAGLSGRFFLEPQRADAPWLSREFDVAVLSSATEGLPTVLTEYMYWGRPCVVTNVGDCAEVVRHGRTGYVVPAGDHEAMAASVVSLLDDAALRASMGRAGRQRVLENYSIERYAADYQALYEAALL